MFDLLNEYPNNGSFIGNIKYTLISFIFYAVGIPLYMWARHQHGKKHIYQGRIDFCNCNCGLVAIYGIYALIH